jgi:hypothetical protein
MIILTKSYKVKQRKKKHISYLEQRIYNLKYEILNDALLKQVNINKIDLFHKYQKRLLMLTFMRNV